MSVDAIAHGVDGMAGTTPVFACTSWDDGHLVIHVGLPFHQTQPPAGTIAFGATKCGRAMRLNGTHPRATQQCIECYRP